jgi:3,4-dihydroxy 2-butanone 4-phosphate synthase / GTP cyclohydrolase II
VNAFSESQKIPLVKISEIIQYRLRFEPLITKVAKAKLPTEDYGEFTAHCYLSNHDKAEHLVLTKGLSEEPTSPTLVRMHSERKLGDLFLHTKEESRNKLNSALQKINEYGSGALVYIRKHKTHFISEQLKQMKPESTKDAASKMEKVTELRELGIGAQMLLDLHIRELKLLTSSQSNLIDLSVFNLKIKELVSL